MMMNLSLLMSNMSKITFWSILQGEFHVILSKFRNPTLNHTVRSSRSAILSCCRAMYSAVLGSNVRRRSCEIQ